MAVQRDDRALLKESRNAPKERLRRMPILPIQNKNFRSFGCTMAASIYLSAACHAAGELIAEGIEVLALYLDCGAARGVWYKIGLWLRRGLYLHLRRLRFPYRRVDDGSTAAE